MSDWIYDHLGIVTLTAIAGVIVLTFWLASAVSTENTRRCNALLERAVTRADSLTVYATPIGYKGAACAGYIEP